MKFPVSIKGVLLIDGKVVLLRNERDEWELPGGRAAAGETAQQALSGEHKEVGLHAVAELERIVLPAGYVRSIQSWSMHAES